MRIKKTSQYIEGGASISNVYGTSNSNGYSQDYINNAINGTILWTNSSPTSNFAGQSITLSEAIENFSKYEVIYKRQASANTFISSGKLPISSRNRIDLANGYLYSRAISVLSGTTLTFEDCTYYATYGNTTTTNDNSTLIPYMVIGYVIGSISSTQQTRSIPSENEEESNEETR